MSATTAETPNQIVRARAEDAPGIAALLAACSPECIPQSAPFVARHIESFEVIRGADGAVDGCVSLRALDPWRIELRGLAVHERRRGEGLGRELLRRAKERALVLGLQLVCVTRCPGFFERQGFQRIPLHALPEKPAARRLPRRTERVAMELALPWVTPAMGSPSMSWSQPTSSRAPRSRAA